MNHHPLRTVDFYYARTGNSLRVAIALELTETPHKLHPIDLAGGEHRGEAFTAINPARHLPVLVITENGKKHMLSQSAAIVEYLLAPRRPDLWPSDPIKRAQCVAMMYAAISDIGIQFALARYLKSDYPTAAAFVLKRMWSDIFALFLPLQESPYLCGDKVTVAAYINFPAIFMRENELKRFPDVEPIIGWLERMKKDEAVSRAIEYAGNQFESVDS